MKKFLLKATFQGPTHYEDDEPITKRVMLDRTELNSVDAYAYMIENYLRQSMEEELGIKFFSREEDWYDITGLLSLTTKENVETGASVLRIPIGYTNLETFFATIAISGKTKKYIEGISIVTAPYNERHSMLVQVYINDVTSQYEKLIELPKEELVELLIIANGN